MDDVERLLGKLSRFLPVSWDNEVDGHGEPTHAVLTFGEHQTQAITLCPDDWMALNDIPTTITRLSEENERLRDLVERALHFVSDYQPTPPGKLEAEMRSATQGESSRGKL